MKYAYCFLFMFVFGFSFSFSDDYVISSFDNHRIHGTLLESAESNSVLTIIVSGSGPTDRDGNNISLKSDCLKMLAEGLYEKGVSSYRFDKRGVGRSIGSIEREDEVKFADFINDVKSIINHFKNTKRFERVVVIGHSEGALIGMIASRSIAEGFISIAGAGTDYLAIIQRQLSNRAPYVRSMSDSIIQQLRNGKIIDSVSPLMSGLFNQATQRFLIDASGYNPTEEISKLDIPVLIIQGANDIQIEVKDAQILNDASVNSRLEIIQGMNHVFRQASENFILNLQTYGRPELPIDSSLVGIISDFINDI